MSTCRSRCYDNSGRVSGGDSLVETVQVTRQATFQCAPCAVDSGGGGGGGGASFTVAGRLEAGNVDANTNYWALDSVTNDLFVTSPNLPYTLAGDVTVEHACWLAPRAGTASTLSVRNGTSMPLGGETRTVALFIGRPGTSSSTVTAASVVFTAASPALLETTSATAFAFEAGDLLSIGVTNSDTDTYQLTFAVTMLL